MSTQRSPRFSLAAAVALALFGAASIAAAQTPPPQPPMQQQVPPPPVNPVPPPPPAPMPPPRQQMPQPQPPPPPPPDQPAAATGQFYQGTESSAQYPIQDGTLTVNSGMPAQVKNYGPPPPFSTLDTNHDGRITEAEAQAYPPLDSDFLYASGQGKYITKAQYKKWVAAQH